MRTPLLRDQEHVSRDPREHRMHVRPESRPVTHLLLMLLRLALSGGKTGYNNFLMLRVVSYKFCHPIMAG